jgi:hypothetical protein
MCGMATQPGDPIASPPAAARNDARVGFASLGLDLKLSSPAGSSRLFACPVLDCNALLIAALCRR